VFFIKIKVKTKLVNLTENTKDLINTNGFKNSNTISFIDNDIKYKLIIDDNKVTLLRESNEFSHQMIFKENKTYSSEYYLKESKYSIELNILTTKLNISKNIIDITYKVLESDTIYNYVLEVSDEI